MTALHALLATVSLAQSIPSPEGIPFRLVEDPIAVSDAVHDFRVPAAVLKRRGRVTTYVGVGTMAAAIPAGFAVAGLLSRGCEFECMGAPIFGATTSVGMLTVGGVVALAGVTTSAIGRGRENRTLRVGPGGLTGTF